MRHKRLNKRFGRNNSQRKMLMRALLRSLFISCRMETTIDKAKQTRRIAERIISRAKSGKVSDLRFIEKTLQDRGITSNILKNIVPLFQGKNSGFTRIVRTGFRKGDGAQMAVLELTSMPVKESKPVKKKKEKETKPAPEAGPKEEPKKEDVKPKVEPELKPKVKEKRGLFKKIFRQREK